MHCSLTPIESSNQLANIKEAPEYLRASPSCATAMAKDLCNRAMSVSYRASSALVTQSCQRHAMVKSTNVQGHPRSRRVSVAHLKVRCDVARGNMPCLNPPVPLQLYSHRHGRQRHFEEPCKDGYLMKSGNPP